MSKPAVVLQFSTKLEAQPYIDALHLSLVQQKPFSLFFGDSSLYILISGIGITRAAIAATYAYTTLNADTIINIGAAGALRKSLALGQIATVHTIYDTSRFNLVTEKPFYYALTPFGNLPSLCCVSVIMPLRTADMRNQYSPLADIVDMELAGIAHTAQKFAKKCFCIKYISDTNAHNTHESIIANIKELATETSLEILKCIHYDNDII